MSLDETNSLGKRVRRYAHVSGAVMQVGAGALGRHVLGGGRGKEGEGAALLKSALGDLKGPLMKVAQLIAGIPDLMPPDYAAELATLQSNAPSMGWPFVRRRMAAELGPDWQKKFHSFETQSAAAASLGQVHRAVSLAGEALACKLQYPDMAAVVEADLQQLKILFSLFERFDGSINTQDAYQEVADRLREELDYRREADNMRLYGAMLADVEGVHVPRPLSELSTNRLLCMTWLDGVKITEVLPSLSQEERNKVAMNMFRLWYTPFYRYGVLHGDPHMGNYTLRPDGDVNLLDFGCIRIFRPEIVQAVVTLYHALKHEDQAQIVEAYRLWGFEGLNKEQIDVLTLWARFVYAPLLEDRSRTLHETNATQHGRDVAGRVHRELKKLGGTIRIPPEFVLIDRASIGLGGLFLRLEAEVNWCRLFEEVTQDFSAETLETSRRSLSL